MNKYDKPLMETAYVWAKQSSCTRRQVGGVISKDGRIIVIGYNGTISGESNDCEEPEYKCPECNVTSKEPEKIFDYISANKEMMIDDPYNQKILLKGICKKCSSYLSSFIDMDTEMNYGSTFNENLAKKIFYDHYKEMVTSDFTLHAEQNIISFAAKHGISLKDTILHITLSPCKICAKLLAQSGIKEIIYDKEYKDKSGIKFLNKLKHIEIRKYMEK